jgi:hypothetical protein
VRVPAKIIVLHSKDVAAEEALISDISKYANSQNSVKQSDLSANKPFHVELEKLALSTYCPDGVGRWFYERASGSYNTTLAREGATPARLRQLRGVVIPPARKVTKTDLAKFINAWEQRPDTVSLGSQKNFDAFMFELKALEESGKTIFPDVAGYKQMIAQAILFKKAQSVVRGIVPAFQANVAAYLVALIANRLGGRIDMEKIWTRQDVSAALLQQMRAWAPEVNEVLHRTAAGRMVSEWAKKAECWEAVRSATYSEPVTGIN